MKFAYFHGDHQLNISRLSQKIKSFHEIWNGYFPPLMVTLPDINLIIADLLFFTLDNMFLKTIKSRSYFVSRFCFSFLNLNDVYFGLEIMDEQLFQMHVSSSFAEDNPLLLVNKPDVVGEAFQSSNNQGQTEKMKIIRPYFNIVKSTSFRLKKERKTGKKRIYKNMI